jgi:ribosomal protein S18 acetylase RimI-like enzyme
MKRMSKTDLSKTTEEVLIRDLRKSDLSDLLSLLLVCFGKEFEISGLDPDHVTDMVNRVFGRTGSLLLGLMRLFGKEPLKLLVAEAEGRIVGTTLINLREKSGYISSVMVHTDHRRRGIAATLMTSALEYIREKKKMRAVLHVDSTNAPAISLYAKLGFRTFDHSAYFVGKTNSMAAQENTSRVEIRRFQNEDLDHVYSMAESSEDPDSLRIFDFSKKNLKISFLQRRFYFAIRKQLVAVVDGRQVGYIEAIYTTPKEVGRISSIYVNAEGRSLAVEKLLIDAARNEIAKGGVEKTRITVPTTKQELVEIVKELGFEEALVMDAMVAEFH